MKIKVDFIEMIWDNYQGASGMPVKRSILIDVPAETLIANLESIVINKLTENGIKRTFGQAEAHYPKSGILSISILPTL